VVVEGGCGEAKGKVKNNMARNKDTLSGKVHAEIALMMR
jgi:uncharacterized protein YjbJ (UPF0337 family)